MHAAMILAARLPPSHRVILIERNSHFNRKSPLTQTSMSFRASPSTLDTSTRHLCHIPQYLTKHSLADRSMGGAQPLVLYRYTTAAFPA